MSSEENGGNMQQVLYVKPLPWRECKVTKFLRQMDDKAKKRQTKRSKQASVFTVVLIAS